MNILIKPRKNRYIIYAIIIALFSTIGMQISLLNINTEQIFKRLEYRSMLIHFIAILKKSISGRGETDLLYSIIGCGIFLLFLIIFSYKFSKREIVSATCLAILFGICRWIGVVFSHKESWDYFLRNKYIVLLDIWYIAGYILFAFGIFLLMGKMIIGYQKKNKNFFKAKYEKMYDFKHIFFLCALIILVCWLPYYVSLWPGAIHGDFSMQVLQLFHYPTILQGQLTSDGINILYSNDHPFIHTQILGFFIKIGIRLKHVSWGYGIYTFLQMSAYIIGIALLLATLNKFAVDQLILKVVLFIYALIPVFPLYSILVGGDAFFSLMFLYFMIEVIWIFGTKGKIFYNKKFNGIMIITAFLLMAAKNQGLYVFCMFFIICLIYFRKYFRKVLISMFVPILCFQFIYVGMIFPICKVGVVGEQEKLSVCFQQTARYIKYYKDEVTKEEKNAINKVLDYEKIGNNYNPELADPVKNTYKTSATSMDLNNCFFVWLKMGLKHPVEYIEAFIANTYAYYAPLLTTNRGLYLKLNSMKFYKKTRPWVKDTIPQTFINKNNCESPRRLKKIRKTVITFCKLTYHIPVINWLYNPGVITWLMFMAFFVFWTRKEYDSMITFIPLLLIFGICLLSPKNNNLRYIYPTCCMIPAMLAAAFGEKNPDL